MASRIRFSVLLAGIMGAVLLVSQVVSAGVVSERRSGFLDRDFAGGRIGVWENTGDENGDPEDNFDMEFSSTSVFAEFFYDYRVGPALAAEISIGIYSRGEVKYIRESDTYLGSVNLYPIMLGAKFYPFYAVKTSPLHLFLQPAVGIVIGRQNVVDYDESLGLGIVIDESRARFTYSLGLGFDWPVADQIGLTGNFKYTPVKFGEELARVSDYSGWSLTFGVGYIFSRK